MNAQNVRNRQFVLRERPTGRIQAGHLRAAGEAGPRIREGEALVRVEWMSLDPTNRA